jgi:serine/threonine protein kinase
LRASDLWAIGLVLFEAATGKHPYFEPGEGLSYSEALGRMSSPPNIPDHVPADVADVVRRCLSDPPYQRGTVVKALGRLT